MELQKQNTTTKYSDTELIDAYKKSENVQYVGTLFKRYSQFVFLVSMKYLKNEEHAHNAAAIVFEKLITELKIHKITYFKSWLYTVTKNECMMIFRKKQRRQKKRLEYEKETKSFVEFEHADHLNEKEEKEEKIEELGKALNQLNPEQKQSIELFYLEQKSYAEVCEITGYEIKKIKSYIQNGKRNLKNILTEAGLFIITLFIGI